MQLGDADSSYSRLKLWGSWVLSNELPADAEAAKQGPVPEASASEQALNVLGTARCYQSLLCTASACTATAGYCLARLCRGAFCNRAHDRAGCACQALLMN